MESIKKIIIVNHRDNHGGPIVLSKLCSLLRERGYDARLFFLHEFPVKGTRPIFFWIKWCYYILFIGTFKLIVSKIFKGAKFLEKPSFANYSYVPVKGCKRQFLPFYNKDNTIVVYPECYGNIMKAKNVVRWFLYFYKYAETEGAYSKNDLFICYLWKYNTDALNPDHKTVRLNHFDSDLYKQYNFGSRKEKCYLIRKGYKRKDLPKTFDGPVIDFGTTDREIVRIFNEYKYCYFYDLNTFLSKIAAVCGCIPILVVEKGKSLIDYNGVKNDLHLGQAIGDSEEQIQYAINTREGLLKSLNFDETNNKFIDNFIKYVEEHFLNKTI